MTTKPTLFKKLFFWFLLTVFLPLGISGYVNYKNYIKILEQEKTGVLLSIAENKIVNIENYLQEAKRITAVLSAAPVVMDAVDTFASVFENGINSPAYEEADKHFRPRLSKHKELLELNDILIISSKGSVIFSILRESDLGTNLITGRYKDGQLAKAFKDFTLSQRIEVSNFSYYPPSRKPALFTLAPILKDEIVMGFIAVQLNTEKIYALTSDYKGLGSTGEILLGLKIDTDVVFANPLRHDPSAAFSKKIAIGSPLALPAQQAVQGIDGSGTSTDYRGEQVLAVWKYLPSARWGLVAKIDTKEALAPVISVRNWTLFICIVTACAGLLAAFYVSKSIARPIQVLQKGVEIVGSGNLDYQVGMSSDDEIGRLSRAFDAMTENLKKITSSRDELNKVTIELERSNQELLQFAYVASHDLQEPLRMVAGFTSLLERRYKDKLDRDAQEFIRFAVDGAVRMQKLIDDLLTYSRVGSHHIPFEAVDCNYLLDQAIINLRVAIEESHAVITRGNLPMVPCNGLQMIQLFQNLISNAVKFRGTDPPRIHIAAERRGEEWLFSFRDNGIGIDPQYHDRIFKIFQRLHSRDEYAGTGIGLALCMKIVELHKGRIWMESELGKGTTVYFTLPEPGDSASMSNR
jgi:signal transduction histidine kinase